MGRNKISVLAVSMPAKGPRSLSRIKLGGSWIQTSPVHYHSGWTTQGGAEHLADIKQHAWRLKFKSKAEHVGTQMVWTMLDVRFRYMCTRDDHPPWWGTK